MKKNFYQYIFATSCLLLLTAGLFAQDGSALPTEQEPEEKKLRFNGLGRAYILQTGLDGDIRDSDTTSVNSLTDGEFLLDLAINATPNDKTEVQGILRLRNEFGGFFGAGVSVEVRELWARGIIANAIKYRVGDMDLAMTPYTLFNPDEEGMVNEPEIFRPQKEVIYYEQFYQDGNTRRLQGAKFDFGLDFTKVLRDMDVSGFISRIRGTDFFTVPTRFLGGGHIGFNTQGIDSLGAKAHLGLNLAHTWDDLQSGEATSGIRNSVYSADFDITVYEKEKIAIHVLGEAGISNLESKEGEESIFKEDDTFLEAGAKVHFKEKNFSVSAAFVDVGPDFFSIAAQSKRVDFDRNKTYYNRIGKDNFIRMPTIFDLGRDRALYTYQLSDRLMSYDPRLSNTMPYGKATPNRRGIRFGLQRGSEDDMLEVGVNASFLEEIRGQGTFELKQFALLRGMANWRIHQMAKWKKNLTLTLGYQYEQTTRDGIEIDQVDLTSNILEVGLSAELFTDFELLLGVKNLSSNGSDYVPLIEEFNDVKDFPGRFIADDVETLLAGGFRYNFKEGIYLTLQYQQFNFSRATDPANDYQLNQVFVLYSMDF